MKKDKDLKAALALGVLLLLTSCTLDSGAALTTPAQPKGAVLTVTPAVATVSTTPALEPSGTPTSDHVPSLPPTPEQTFGSARFTAGPFDFDFRLYRNPGFGQEPPLPWMYSDLPGIGTHVSWVYRGTGLEGPVTEHWGIFPETFAFVTYPALQEGANSAREGGIALPPEAQAGDEVQYIFKLETPQGTYGGAIEVTLQRTADGFQPANVKFAPLSE